MSNSISLSRLAVGAAATAATSASGAVVVFDFPDTSYDNLNATGTISIGSIDMGNGTFNPFSAGAPGFTAEMNYDYGLVFKGYDVRAAMNGEYLGVVSAGSLITSGMTFSPNDSSVSNFGSSLPREIFYLGLTMTVSGQQHYGWLELSAADAPPGGYTTVTFRRFAFEDIAGQSITTPAAVPEASTLGFAGGLFGLVVAAHLRRRKAAHAAAPDSLLKLASGESIRN